MEESEQLHPALVLIGQQDRTGSTGRKEEACTGHTWSVGSHLMGGRGRIAKLRLGGEQQLVWGDHPVVVQLVQHLPQLLVQE